MALQALYEIDQSSHPAATVVAGRVDDLLRSGAKNGVAAEDWPIAGELIDHFAATGFDAVDGAVEAARRGLPPERVEAVLTILVELQKQAEYGTAIVWGIGRNVAVIDSVIGRIAPEWPVDQMAPLDRNVLRIALWEIGQGRVPVRVAINEAVEMARRFSGEGARRMVNGALGAFAASGATLNLLPADADRGGDGPRLAVPLPG